MKVIIEFELDSSWNDYEKTIDELLIEDMFNNLKEGIKINNITRIPQEDER